MKPANTQHKLFTDEKMHIGHNCFKEYLNCLIYNRAVLSLRDGIEITSQ